ncbi:MAG: hypothetical protein KGN01_06725 [Patescibacteria group bacterium]|nr:hypothetical protein [Patescibacteria group bacterium]
MPKWKKDATEFIVTVTYNDEKGSQVTVPKPLLERLDHPDKIRFLIAGKTILVESADL